MSSKSVSEWLHERGFDEVDLTPREGKFFVSSRRKRRGPLASAEASILEEGDVEERGAMEFATNTQKATKMDAQAEKPPKPM